MHWHRKPARTQRSGDDAARPFRVECGSGGSEPTKVTEEEDEEVVRALLGKPASSRPTGSHAEALPASTKKDEWVYKPGLLVLIRVHHPPRKCLFTPKNVDDCPVPVGSPSRTRVVSQYDESREDISDGWSGL